MKISISKSYQEEIVFNNFNLEIIDNKINILIGPSGCGKTTLLQCIANLCDYKGNITPNIKSIGYIFQEDRLLPYLTILKNLFIIDNDFKKIKNLLKHFNVYNLKNKYPHQLSGGEKQRISIIRAFLRKNDLILMDEPFKSLDYNLKLNLVDMIYKLYNKTNKTIILVTHDLDIALYLGEYIHVLSDKVTSLRKTIENTYAFQDLNEKSLVIHNQLKDYMRKNNGN